MADYEGKHCASVWCKAVLKAQQLREMGEERSTGYRWWLFRMSGFGQGIFFSFKTHFHLPFQANHAEASCSHFVESAVLVFCLVTFKLKLSPVLSYGKCMLRKNK